MPVIFKNILLFILKYLYIISSIFLCSSCNFQSLFLCLSCNIQRHIYVNLEGYILHYYIWGYFYVQRYPVQGYFSYSSCSIQGYSSAHYIIFKEYFCATIIFKDTYVLSCNAQGVLLCLFHNIIGYLCFYSRSIFVHTLQGFKNLRVLILSNTYKFLEWSIVLETMDISCFFCNSLRDGYSEASIA